MKAVIIMFLLLCASLNIEAQKSINSSERQLAEVINERRIWPCPVGSNVNVHAIVINSKNWIFAAAVGDGFEDGLIWRSKDRGETWEHLTKGLQNVSFWGVTGLYSVHDTLFAGGLDGIWRSTNGGERWENVLYLYEGAGIWDFIQANDGRIFACGNTIYESNDGGNSWHAIDNSRLPSVALWPMDDFVKTKNGTLFVSSRGVLKSTDNGQTWIISDSLWYDENLPRSGSLVFDPLDGSLYKSTIDYDKRMFRSDDEGKTWRAINDQFIADPLINVFCMISSPNYGIFVGLSYPGLGGIYNSIDGGESWHYVCLKESVIMSFAWLSQDTLLVGTWEGMYIVVLGKVTSVSVGEKTSAPDFSLSQNYPNPFNPSTKINFSVPKLSFVTLKVYDVLGKEVTTLVQEEKSPGSYSVEFNASNLPSGTYFYRLQIDNIAETKKMMFLK